MIMLLEKTFQELTYSSELLSSWLLDFFTLKYDVSYCARERPIRDLGRISGLSWCRGTNYIYVLATMKISSTGIISEIHSQILQLNPYQWLSVMPCVICFKIVLVYAWV